MPKNLLIGSITNYVWDDVAAFFNSYMQAGFENCDCVMFTGNMSEHTLEKIRAYGVTVLPIPEEYLGGQIVIYRFYLYKKFLQENAGKYDMVLASDVRDVIFQRDLFSLYDASKPFLGVAVEDNTLAQQTNKQWIAECYGEDIHQSIQDNNIICMGTVWGTSREFLSFLEELTRELDAYHAINKPVNDQGSANVIIYYNKKFSDILTRSTNYDGYVMTVGFTDAAKLKVDSSGYLLNGKGEVAAVVHQYQVKPAILESVVNKYSAGISAFTKLRMKYRYTFIGRVMRFLRRVCKKA